MKNLGLMYAIAAYFLWGLAPIYWKQLAHIDSVEIVMHRMIWSCVMVVFLIVLIGQWKQLRNYYANKQLLFRLFIASILISVNWGIYIWAVNSGHIIESSMGYFINPLINILFGVLFFNEKLRAVQGIAIAIVVFAVAYLIFVHGKIPYIALSLAVSFACYGAIKKTVVVPATHGMAIETSWLLLPATLYLIYFVPQESSSFGGDTVSSLLLVLGGVFTLIPLLLFSAAAKKITLTALGMTQYIGPTLQLIIGIAIYHEPFGSDQQIAFGLIWLALCIYTFDQIKYQRGLRKSVMPI